MNIIIKQCNRSLEHETSLFSKVPVKTGRWDSVLTVGFENDDNFTKMAIY